MADITPIWTDNVTVLAPWAVIKGERKSVTLDLRTKVGAELFYAIACGGSTGITSGGYLWAKVFRTINNTGVSPFSSYLWDSISQNTVGYALINNGSNYAAGVNSIAYDGAAGTAFASENTLCLTGVTTIPTSSGAISPNGGVEWLNLAKGATTPAIFSQLTKYLHNDNEFITLGTSRQIWLEGGSLYTIVFDHLFDAAGEAMICAASAQTYDKDTAA